MPIWAIPALALAMALGVLAMIVSLNHFSARPAQADISPSANIPVELSDRGLGQTATYSVGPFSSNTALTGGVSTLTFTFPVGFNVTGATTGSQVNNTAATVGVTGQVVTVTAPQNIGANTNITVELAGIVNPNTYNVTHTITVDDDAGGAPARPTSPIPLANFTGAVPGADVTATTDGIASPNTAGQLAEYQFTFVVNQNIPANIGEVRITFDKDTLVPDLIPQNGIQFQADLLTNALGQGNIGTGGANQVVTARISPVLDVDDTDPRRRELIVKVPDMDPTTGDVGQAGQGVQGIAAGARVRMLITTTAGVRNATERENSGIDIQACSSACTGAHNVIAGADTTASVFIKNVVRVNDVDGSRGASVTVIGLGYNDGTTATVWLDNGVDLNGDGVIDTPAELALHNDGVKQSQERELGRVIVNSDDTFSLQVTVGNPPFVSGTLDEPVVGLDLNGDGDAVDLNVRFNVINAQDGELASLSRMMSPSINWSLPSRSPLLKPIY
jgi:hypothetical protein